MRMAGSSATFFQAAPPTGETGAAQESGDQESIAIGLVPSVTWRGLSLRGPYTGPRWGVCDLNFTDCTVGISAFDMVRMEARARSGEGEFLRLTPLRICAFCINCAESASGSRRSDGWWTPGGVRAAVSTPPPYAAPVIR